MTSKRKRLLWILGAAASLLAAPFVLSLAGFLPWSPVNCWHYDVDIHSGRVRYTRYFAWIQVLQRVDETALSGALKPDDLPGAPGDWRRAHTLSPGTGHSPHYIFHSALAQIRQLEMAWKVGEFTPAARRASARRLLALWQPGQRDDAANPYLRAVSDLAFSQGADHKSTDESDLPAAQ